MTGQTESSSDTFPAVAGPLLASNGDFDAFVAKVNAAGTALLYAGYIGESEDDIGWRPRSTTLPCAMSVTKPPTMRCYRRMRHSRHEHGQATY
ncbi:hypothetical protein HC928_22775 [bacterium]|nr:hypothetical protein [bacterium]